MTLNDPVRVLDGFEDLSGGQDSGRSPSLIGQNQCARAENVAFRGGFATSRPGFGELDHHFHNELYYDTNGFYSATEIGDNSEAAFNEGVFQGAWYYSPPNQGEVLVASINGRLFRIDPKPGTHLDITEIKLDRRNSSDLPISYMVQADKYLIVQDGQSKAIIYDGVTARRAGLDEVITGTIMAYGMGRLVVAKGQDVYFGDLYGSHPGDPGASVLKFTETTFLNEGGPAAISPAMGKITALSFTPQQDSSTGDGELLAFAERGVTSFFVSTPREQWKESAFQRITLLNVGGRGHRAITSINGDVWFRADDGVRSYRQARAEVQGWAHLPMSTEVRPYIEADTPAWLDYGSAIKFDNRLLMTCTPRPNNGRVYHNGLLSLDFDVLSTFGEATRPAWDGHWTKPKITQLVAGMFHGEHRAFAFSITDDENVIYEISKHRKNDYDGGISSELVGRSMTFVSGGQQMPFNEKELIGADLWLDDVTDSLTGFTIDYKPDQHPEWIEWHTINDIEPVGVCQEVTCGGVPTIRKNFTPRKRIGKPSDECDSEWTKRFLRRAYEFQPRFRWTGHLSIRKVRLHARMLTEISLGGCE